MPDTLFDKKAFTPVRGKAAYLHSWQSKPLTYEKAKQLNSGGVGILHTYAGTCAIDVDDVSVFLDMAGDTLTNLFKGQMQITSPKVNSAKILCTLTTEQQNYLHTRKLLSDKGVVVEFRMTGQDVLPGSDYPTGGSYGSEGAIMPQPLPDRIYQLWHSTIEKLPQSIPPKGTISPKDKKGNWSAVSNYIRTHNLEDLLVKYGYVKKGKRWLSPNQESGMAACEIFPSKSRGEVLFSYSASDAKVHKTISNPLYGEINLAIDAAALYTHYEHKGNSRNAIAAMYKMEFLNPDTGEILKSVEAANGVSESALSISDVSIIWEPLEEPPPFDMSIIHNLPEPFPLLIDNFKEMIYDPVGALYGPMFMCVSEVLLQAKIRTVRGRSVNMNYANGTLSGGGKDDNTFEAVSRLTTCVRDLLKKYPGESNSIMLVQRLLTPITASFTSGTNYMQALHDTSVTEDSKPLGGLVLSTEATKFYKMISNTTNENVSSVVTDIEVEAYNGIVINGRKVGRDRTKHLDPIRNPNFSFYRLTQLEPFKEAFTHYLLDIGYYPRIFETYDMRKNKEYVASAEFSEASANPDEKGLMFLLFMAKKVSTIPDMVVKSNVQGSAINKWEIEVIGALYKKMTPEKFPGIKRIPQMLEKWVSTIAAYIYFWRLFNKEDVSDLVIKKDQFGNATVLDGTSFEKYVLPMADYIARTKYFTITNYITKVAGALDIALAELWHTCIKIMNGKNHGATYGPWLKDGRIPLQMFMTKVRNKHSIVKLFKDDQDRLARAIDRWFRDNGLTKQAGLKGNNTRKVKVCIVPQSEVRLN